MEKHVAQSYATGNPIPQADAGLQSLQSVTEQVPSGGEGSRSIGGRYAYPFPDAITGLGRRHIEAFTPCDNCGVGTWARYGPWALCLQCSNLGRPGPTQAPPSGAHGDACDCLACVPEFDS